MLTKLHVYEQMWGSLLIALRVLCVYSWCLMQGCIPSCVFVPSIHIYAEDVMKSIHDMNAILCLYTWKQIHFCYGVPYGKTSTVNTTQQSECQTNWDRFFSYDFFWIYVWSVYSRKLIYLLRRNSSADFTQNTGLFNCEYRITKLLFVLFTMLKAKIGSL